jgi:hypothetical protein
MVHNKSRTTGSCVQYKRLNKNLIMKLVPKGESGLSAKLSSAYKTIVDYHEDGQLQRKREGKRYYKKGVGSIAPTKTTASKPNPKPNPKLTDVKKPVAAPIYEGPVDMYGRPITQKQINASDTYNAPVLNEVDVVAPQAVKNQPQKASQPVKSFLPQKFTDLTNSVAIHYGNYGPKAEQKSAATKPTVKSKEEAKSSPKQTYLKPKGEVNQKVIDWQNKLKAEGFDVGKVDGLWGKKTEAAYQAYLKNKQMLEKVGLPEDNAPFLQPRQGFPTPETAYLKKGGSVKDKRGGDETITKDYENINPAFWKDHQNELAAKRLAPNKKTKPNTSIIPEKKDKPELTTDKYNKKAKGGSMPTKKKKCACGCAMKITKNAKGGLIESCACGCKTKK